MLLLQRNKSQSLTPRRSLDAHTNIRFALSNGQSEIILAEGRVGGPCQVPGVDAVASEQTLQQVADTGIGLAMGQTYAGSGNILKPRKAMRVIRS